MNIIEAMKSGKRYKRKHHRAWYDPIYGLGHPNLDILADDWEVEEEVFKLTEAGIREVVNIVDDAIVTAGLNLYGSRYLKCFINTDYITSKVIEILRDRNMKMDGSDNV